MKMKLTFCFFLLAALLTGCSSASILPGIVGFMKNMDQFTALSRSSNSIPGSQNYVRYIKEIAEVSGDKAALDKVMSDVDKDTSVIGKNSENDLRLYKLVSTLIYKVGHVDMEVHYFRNKLNVAPGNLKEMLKINSSLPPEKQWRLITVGSSLYHMQGEEGIYNLKFVSANGFCEAVYNKHGTLLTENNDPINMGTFNYGAGIPVAGAHKKYDIDPYLEWGNTPDSPQKGSAAINAGTQMAAELYNRNKEEVNNYRVLIMSGGIKSRELHVIQTPVGKKV